MVEDAGLPCLAEMKEKTVSNLAKGAKVQKHFGGSLRKEVAEGAHVCLFATIKKSALRTTNGDLRRNWQKELWCILLQEDGIQRVCLEVKEKCDKF